MKLIRDPIAIVILLAGTALLAVLWHRRSLQVGHRTPAVGTDPVSGLAKGHEIQFVLIGSSTCHGADSKQFQEAVARAKALGRATADSAGVAFSTVGVALDWTPQVGLGFLDRFGPFDQVLSGHNWLNEGAIKYVWRDIPGEPTVPQVVLVDRVVSATGRIEVGQERVLARKLGAYEVEDWLKDPSAMHVIIDSTKPRSVHE